MSSPVPDTNMSSSSVEAEVIAATAAVDITVEDGQLSDDQDSHDRERLLYREKQEREIVRNPILVTIPIQPMNSSIGRT